MSVLSKYPEITDEMLGRAIESAKSHWDSLAAKRERRAYWKKKCFESAGFNAFIAQLRARLEAGDHIATDGAYYTESQAERKFLNRFMFVFDVILSQDSATLIEDEEAMFSTQYFDYKGLRFSQVHGQGTVLMCKLIDKPQMELI